MKCAHYYIMKYDELFTRLPQNVVLIKDIGPWDKFPTITNSAKEVVEDMFSNKSIDKSQRLFYIDSEGNCDEILHKDGEFVGFEAGPKFNK